MAKPDDAPVITTRAAYEASAADWAGRWQDKSFIAHHFDRFREMLQAGDLALDLGCGPGLDAREHAARGLRVVGVDLTRAMLDYARAFSGLTHGLQADLRRLPFANGTFAGVWAGASLLHLPKAQVPGALAEVARILQPLGAFYSSMKLGAHDGLLDPQQGHPVRERRYFAHYGPQEWAGLLREAGFETSEQSIDNPDAVPPDTPWLLTFARLTRGLA